MAVHPPDPFAPADLLEPDDPEELPPDPEDLPPEDLTEASLSPIPAAATPGSLPTRSTHRSRGDRLPPAPADRLATSTEPSTTLAEQALAILRELTQNPEADFHPGQLEAILALAADRRRALVVQRTGWGKSAVYFITALLQRRAGAGPALIVSPLLALMRDQVEAAERAGIRAAAINSANATEWGEIETQLAADAVDVLLVSPERLVNARFRETQLPRLIQACGLLVIDEAHCISDWGHDFRPDYRRIGDLIARLPGEVPILATTATANARVVTDIQEQLSGGQQPVFTLRGPLARESLRLGVLEVGTATRRLAWLEQHLNDLPGSGIVYCLTVAGTEDAARLLTRAGHRVLAYTGRTDPAERLAAEVALKQNQVKALVATSALGMGFDKPDLGFVVHLGAPSSPVAYYQQVGRAGRASDSADVLLLPGSEDREIWHYFATNAMPTQARADAVLAALAEADRPLSSAALEARVDLRRSPLELLLKVLAVEGAVSNVSGGWIATGHPWTYDTERYQRIAAARLTEQEAMLSYQRLDGCRMRFLTEALDDPHAADCGRCDRCAGPWYPTEIELPHLDHATQLLDEVGVPILSRSLWPSGLGNLLGKDAPSGRIPPSEQVVEGRVVARLTDLGWGGRLRELFTTDADGRPIDTTVPDDLGRAVLRMLAAWDWEERPGYVTWVPSQHRPQLVESLATGIATAGQLELLPPLDLDPEAEPSRGPSNSAYRVRDLWRKLSVSDDLAKQLRGSTKPVLLVDDLIDSRWTMSIAGRLLRRAGASAVLPLALATLG